MNKQVRPYHEIQLSNKRNKPPIHAEHGWNLNTFSYVKETRTQKYYVVWLNLDDILENNRTIGISVLHGSK